MLNTTTHALIVKTGSAGWVRVTDLPVAGHDAVVAYAVRARKLFRQVLVLDGDKVAAWLAPSRKVAGGAVYLPGAVAMPTVPRVTASYPASQVFRG